MPTRTPLARTRLPAWRMLCALLALASSLAGCGEPAARAPEGPWVLGRWQAASAEGTSEVAFEREGAGLVLVSEGERVPVREAAPQRYEGEVAQQGVKVRFAFERRGERLHARYTLVTAAGEQALPELDYARVAAAAGTTTGATAGTSAAAATARGEAGAAVAPAPRGPWVVGRWQATTAQGSSEVAFEAQGAGIVLVSDGTRVPLTATGSDRYAGEAAEGEMRLRCAFERRGEQLLARYVLVTREGEQALPEVAYTRVAAGSGAAGSTGGEHPAAMLGHWRFTDVLNDFDMQTQTQTTVLTEINYLLEAGGVMRSWIRTEDGSSGSIPKATGRWRLRGGELEIDKGEGWKSLGRAVLDGARMMLVQGTQKRVYQRQ